MKVKISLQDNFIMKPIYATPGSSGVDLRAYIETDIVIEPMARKLIPTGIKLEIPKGYEAQIRPRSGLSIKHGITVVNAPGTIDSDYRGEIMVALINLGSDFFKVENEMRIAQMVFSKVNIVDFDIIDNVDSNTKRGSGGFGSTGTK